MEGFDDPGIFFSDNFAGDDQQDLNQINFQAVKKKFREFIREFHQGNFNYKYRLVFPPPQRWLSKLAGVVFEIFIYETEKEGYPVAM